jgi:hypothetical protein
MKLWTSSAMSPYGNPYGGITVLAETREEAITKAKAALTAHVEDSYVPRREYVANLIEHLDGIEEVPDGVFIGWDPTEKRR